MLNVLIIKNLLPINSTTDSEKLTEENFSIDRVLEMGKNR